MGRSHLFGRLMACPYIRRIRSEHLPLQSPSDGNPLVGRHLAVLLDVPLFSRLEGAAFFPDPNHLSMVIDDG
jgi:hypothetical protein